ncbi:MAG TPA: PAS domain S-box protein [Bacteroidia bacterium]|nr:PAS domain S-box protein [Bacteroidia bacterium]
MKSVLRNSLLISSIYCLFGVAWVFFSNTILLNYTESISNSENIEIATGILFVAISATAIFILSYFLYKKYTRSLRTYFKIQQELLEKNGKRFRTILEKTDDIISLVDKNGNVMYVSPAFERITGLKGNEIIGKHSSSIMHPEQMEESKIVLEKILNNPGVAVKRTNRFIHKNGNYICVEGTTINLLHDKDIEAIVSNYRDVTEKKLIEKQTAFNHDNLKALINNTSDLMWSVDRNFKLITANKAFDDLVTLMSGKIIEKGNDVLAVGFSHEQKEKFKLFYERAFSGEAFTEVEHSNVPNDFWSEISFYPIYNEGEVVGTACYSRNITENKLAEMRLTEFTSNLIEIKNKLELSEFRLKQAQAIAHVGNWEFDFESGGVLWSDENCRIYGVSPKENKQSYETWRSFIHPEDLKRVLQILENSYNTLIPSSYYYRIVRKDGSIRYVYTVTQFNFDTNGEAVSLYGVTHDVTKQKLAEQEIIIRKDELQALSNHIQNVREEERKLISRELHDELGQQLTALKMDISWIISKQNNTDDATVSKLKEMLQFSDGLIATIRRILADLRPAIIDDLGLIATLEWKCDDFFEKTGIPCHFTSKINERKFDDNFSINVYRIVQESLTNITRHAEAKLVTVLVREDETSFYLEITDDGNGIKNEPTQKVKSFGVLGMKERAVLLGGELSVTGALNKGTSIKLKLPLI